MRKDIEAAGKFLSEHETAKIIISIDTHCLEENGLLIYLDGDVDTLRACSLETVSALQQGLVGCTNPCATPQVLKDSIPKTVYQYLSKDLTSPGHAHKSIILNLACGATIGAAESRSEIFKGYAESHPPSPICSHMLPATAQMQSSPSQTRSPWWPVLWPHFWSLHPHGFSQTRTMTLSFHRHSHPVGAHSIDLSSPSPTQAAIGYTQQWICLSLMVPSHLSPRVWP